MLQNLFRRFLHKLAAVAPGGFSVRPWLHRKRGVHMGKNVWISQYVYIDEVYPEAVTIGNNCTIGLRSTIFTHLHYGGKRTLDDAGPVVIEDDVYIGPHCVILPNVVIGRGAVIKAGTVVSRNVPPGVLYGLPSPAPLARATVPLTRETTYALFVAGLRPLRTRANKRPPDTDSVE